MLTHYLPPVDAFTTGMLPVSSYVISHSLLIPCHHLDSHAFGMFLMYQWPDPTTHITAPNNLSNRHNHGLTVTTPSMPGKAVLAIN
jgi:hypothetical protein